MSRYTLMAAPRPEFPPIDVMQREDGLLVATFGPGTYKANVGAMSGPYSNPINSRLSFKPADTAQSLDYIAGNIVRVRAEILNPRCAQIGRIARTSEGVFINVSGNEDESDLKRLFEGVPGVDGVYLENNGRAFVAHTAFQRGVQTREQFTNGGLARALELTTKPQNFGVIASGEHYPNGVNVFGFGPANIGGVEHRVVFLTSDRSAVGRLGIGDDFGNDGDSYAFGVSSS